VWLRLGGFREALGTRVAALQHAIGAPGGVLTGDEDAALWRNAREFAWAPREASLVRVPISPPTVPPLDAALSRYGAVRRYAVAGNLALIGWRDSLEGLSDLLSGMDLIGQVLLGTPGTRFIGAVKPNVFEDRLRTALDPDARFS
jgi:hypothetical protein